MRVITAPEPTGCPPRSIFLAGGITGCPDWQGDAIEILEEEMFDGTVFNPRRDTFDVGNEDAAREQIEWEWNALRRAMVILFYFPISDGPQPIALYELGAWAKTRRRIVVGTHVEYPRRLDVVEQLRLERLGLYVWDDLVPTVIAAHEALAWP